MDGRVLVGRERELAALDGALSQALGGERPVLFFSGEPGIGKTRMLEALASRAVARGAMVAWGRVWEVGITPAFWPWLQVLGAIETPAEPAPPLGELSATAGASARLTRFGEVRAFLRRRARVAPLVLLLDDLHAADLSSLELLDYLLPELLGARVLFALAAREGDARREAELQLGRVLRSARRLPLARLGRDEVEALVDGRAPAASVFASSEGNPLFVEELVACHLSGGTLGLPRLSSVRGVIRERVARLPEETQRALGAAAVLGREFRARIVAAMAGLPLGGNWLEPARALGMLASAGPSPVDGFRFSHALVAEAIADDLEPSTRAALHLRAARALAEHTPSESLAIAHQLLAAGTLAGADAAPAAERAARESMARLAFEDAAALLERALGALVPSGPHSPLYAAELHCLRAEALQHAARHPAAAAACDQAFACLRALPAEANDGAIGVLFARIALARGLQLTPGRTDPRLVELLRLALEQVPSSDTALRAQLLARLAAAEQPAPDPEGPVARALQAIELATELSASERLNVMYVASAALVEYLAPERLEPLHHEVLALALARGNRWVEVHTRLRACFCALDQSDRSAFERERAAFEAAATALGLPQWLRHVHLLRALVALLEGDFALAESEAEASAALSSALGDAGEGWRLEVHRTIAAWTMTLPPDLGLVARLGLPLPGRAAIAAWFAAQVGDAERARAALAELGPSVPADPDFAIMLAHAVACVGDAAHAARVYTVLAARRQRPVLASMVGSAVLDLNARALLVLAAAAGRFDALDEHAQEALAVAQRLGSPVWAAHIRADWADALERRALPGDIEHARELRDSALADARRYGMPGLLARHPRANESAARAGGPEISTCRAEPATCAAEAPRAALPAPAAQSTAVTLERRGALWVLLGQGEQIHVKDSRGVRMLARLVSEPGRPLHVLDLVGASGVDAGDAGSALDHTARDQYRSRLASLARSREEAEAAADQGGIQRANAEIEALSAELERAFGLGGRERRIGAASERARSNVQRRISHALAQIRAASPRIGEHLAANIRTGTYCVYGPRA